MERSIIAVFLLACIVGSLVCKPLEGFDGNDLEQPIKAQKSRPRLWKRFINPLFGEGGAADFPDSKMRMKRGAEDDCEKLELCKLHARSGHSFLASFQLYFVNKENAKLWDHQAHSAADCEQRFSGCDGGNIAPKPAAQRHQEQFIDYDYE